MNSNEATTSKRKCNIRCNFQQRFLCKRLQGLSYPPTPQTDFPKFRVIEGRPFESTEVDLFGPVYTKMHSKTQ